MQYTCIKKGFAPEEGFLGADRDSRHGNYINILNVRMHGERGISSAKDEETALGKNIPDLGWDGKILLGRFLSCNNLLPFSVLQ